MGRQKNSKRFDRQSGAKIGRVVSGVSGGRLDKY